MTFISLNVAILTKLKKNSTEISDIKISRFRLAVSHYGCLPSVRDPFVFTVKRSRFRVRRHLASFFTRLVTAEPLARSSTANLTML